MTNAVVMPSHLNDYAAWAQIIMAACAFIGIFISIFFSLKTLREIRTDRRMRSVPHLAFEPGGWGVGIEFVKAGRSIPGINPKFVEKIFSNLQLDAESVRTKEIEDKDGGLKIYFFGKLNNSGLGTALETEIRWLPQEVWFGSESFILDKKKLTEPVYCKDLNTIPSNPSHILAGEKAAVSRIPTFIEKDFEKKITRVNGVLIISCKDIFGQIHQTFQRFYLFTFYKDKSPRVHVTFCDLITDIEEIRTIRKMTG